MDQRPPSTNPAEGVVADSEVTGVRPPVDGKTLTAEGITTPPQVQVPPLSKEGYRTSPDQETTAWPPGIPYIVGNEACERFSFYGMRAILYVHLASLYALAGNVQAHAESLAQETSHLFMAGVYALPMIGAILADRLIGKYRTIFYLSLVYCVGQGVLALVDLTGAPDRKLLCMYVGLALIAVGSGGIKPCVSANVGDQFGKGNWFRVRTVYQIFYFSINFGSFFATLLIPIVKDRFGASVAFAIPGVLMFLATMIFWAGRRKFVHVPPRPGGTLGLLDALSSTCLFLAVGHLFVTSSMPLWVILLASGAFLTAGLWLFAWRQRIQQDDGFLAIMFYTLAEYFSGRGRPADAGGTSWLARSRFWGPAVGRFGESAAEGPVAVLKIISVFFLVSIFWALFDQHSTSWIRQAQRMDLAVFSPETMARVRDTLSAVGINWTWGGKILATQVPALNPLMVMLLIPLMNLVYNGLDRLGLKTTPLRRITVGMFIASLAFVIVAVLQRRIDAEGRGNVWVAWQVIPYLAITVAEVMVSITGLEFAYTQAPKRMKSTVMGFWLLTVTLGNVLVAFLSGFKDLPLERFFWIFAALMAGAGVVFGLRAFFYVPRDYAQE
jgi:proton-dependent oligopeptide transporter, POT family